MIMIMITTMMIMITTIMIMITTMMILIIMISSHLPPLRTVEPSGRVVAVQ